MSQSIRSRPASPSYVSPACRGPAEAPGGRQTEPPGGGPQAAELPAAGQRAAALGRLGPGSPPAGGDGDRRGLGPGSAGATPGAPAGDGGAEEQVETAGVNQN